MKVHARCVWLSGLLCTIACGGSDASTPPPASVGGSGGTATGGGNGGVASGGGAGIGGTIGQGASSGATTGGDGGIGGVSNAIGCTSVVATKGDNSVVEISDMVIDYPLSGTPAESHIDVVLMLFDGTSTSLDDVDPSSLQHDFYTPRQLGDVYFNDPNGVHAFISEASYGKVSMAGRVVGWIDIGPTTVAADDFRERRDYYAGLAASHINLADYDVAYIVALTDGDDGMQVGWHMEYNTLAGVFPIGIDWMVNSEFWKDAGGLGLASLVLPSTSWAHELLHTFGISGHDNSLDCDQATLASACEIKAYGNSFSLMGEFAFATHPATHMKDRLGWLEVGQMQHVDTSGRYGLCPVASADGQPKGLSIPLKQDIVVAGSNGDAVFDRIHVEYRGAVGFDRYVDRLTSDYVDRYKPEGDVRSDGVLISLGYESTDTDSSVLLDVHPDSSFDANQGIKWSGNAGKFADAILAVGETFSLDDQGISITTDELTSDGGVLISVTY